MEFKQYCDYVAKAVEKALNETGSYSVEAKPVIKNNGYELMGLPSWIMTRLARKAGIFLHVSIWRNIITITSMPLQLEQSCIKLIR